jgi:hypothetical protein
MACGQSGKARIFTNVHGHHEAAHEVDFVSQRAGQSVEQMNSYIATKIGKS